MHWGFGSIGERAANAAIFTLARFVAPDLATASGRAIVEERYASLRRQVPIVYLLGFVNLAGMEMATVGQLVPGANLPTGHLQATCESCLLPIERRQNRWGVGPGAGGEIVKPHI